MSNQSQMLLDLEKVIEEDSLRGKGMQYKSLSPSNTVVGGKSILNISKAIKLPCYKFGKFSTKNIFIAHDSESIFYVFVNPKYKNYRKAFQQIVGKIPDNFHVDHVLSRNLAVHFGYQYVLLCIIPGKVNSKHGRFEKIKISKSIETLEICYPDERIYHKVLFRNPTARQTKENLNKGYSPAAILRYGLTLKQKGIWNTAFGFDLLDMKNLIEKSLLECFFAAVGLRSNLRLLPLLALRKPTLRRCCASGQQHWWGF